MVCARLSRPESGPGRRLACDQGKAAYADRRADRLRQDARRLSRRDRRPRPAGSRGRARERGAGRLRVAAQGALERHPPESRGAARRHKARARARGIPRRRDPHPRPDRRHGRQRARPHAPQPAAYPRDDARVALRAARLRVRAQNAGDDKDGDPRRDPRRRAEQAWRASRAFARTPVRALRRPVFSASGSRPPRTRSARSRTSWSAQTEGGDPAAEVAIVDSGHQRAARSRDRDAGVAARSGHVERGLEPGLRAARGPHPRPQDHARLRQHAAHERARGARARRSPRRATRSPPITAAWPRSGALPPSSD